MADEISMLEVPPPAEEVSCPADSVKFGEKLQWLKSVSCGAPKYSCKANINKTTLQTFESIFTTESPNPVVYLHGFYLSLEDLAGVLDKNWVNDNIITFFASLINQQFAQYRTYFLYLNQLSDLKRVAKNLQKTAGDSLAGMQILFGLNVCNVDGITHVGDVNKGECKIIANHFTLAVYSFDRAELIYADTLGWPFPVSFSRNLNTLLSHLEKKSPSKLKLAHDPQSFVKVEGHQDGNSTEIKHTCSEKCCKNYPMQKCSSVCGVAVIVGACVATFGRSLFHSLLNLNGNATDPGLCYLKDISDYSDFLRLVIIDWMISGQICIDKLLRVSASESPGQVSKIHWQKDASKSDTTPNSHAKVTSTNGRKQVLVMHPSSKSSLPKMRHSFRTSQIDKFLVSKPYLSHIKVKGVNKLRLDARLKCGTFYSRKFLCSSIGKADHETVERIQSFLDSPDCLREVSELCSVRMGATKKTDTQEESSAAGKYLVGAPQISYVRTKKCFRLRCILKTGQTKCKSFHCLAGKAEQASVRQEVHEFMQKQDFVKWLLGKEDWSLPPDPEWHAVAKIPVGTPTMDFLKQLTFPFQKHFEINHNIVSIEKQNDDQCSPCDSLKRVSHHLDDIYTKKEKSSSRNQIAAWIWITCSSRSNECHSACGLELSSSTLLSAPRDNFLCPRCGVFLQGEHTCSICGANNSPQWLKLEDRPVCKMCYQQVTRGHRKTEAIVRQGTKKRFYHSHLKCHWKMKLVLMSNDLNMWNVLIHKDNKLYHKNEEAYPALLNSELIPENMDNTVSYDDGFGIANNDTEPDGAQDARLLADGKSNEIQADKGLDSVIGTEQHGSDDADGTGCKKLKCGDGKSKNSAAAQTDFEVETFTDVLVLPVACGLCISIGKDVFTCGSQEQLFEHVNKMHLYHIMSCNMCHSKGILSSFPTEKLLAEHVASEHKNV